MMITKFNNPDNVPVRKDSAMFTIKYPMELEILFPVLIEAITNAAFQKISELVASLIAYKIGSQIINRQVGIIIIKPNDDYPDDITKIVISMDAEEFIPLSRLLVFSKTSI